MSMLRLTHDRKILLAILATVVLVLGVMAVVHAATTTEASCTGGPVTQTTTAQTFSVECSVPLPPATTVTATATVTATVTATPTPGPTPTESPSQSVTPSPTQTATPSQTAPPTSPAGYACVVQLGANCPTTPGPGGQSGYKTSKIPNSNGWNTYVGDQDVGWQGVGTETLSANSPSDWQVVSNLGTCGGCVQTFANVQQLFNNWGNGGWNGGANTPISALSELRVNYVETSPGGSANSYEFAPDIWQEGYPSDVMFWVDTNGRCNEGAFGSTVLGHFTMDGQAWTAHRYGGVGAEIILILDGPGGPGTCAQQSSGSINIKAGLEWLASHGFIPASPVISQLNSGWEITESKHATFTLHDYSITATPK